MFRLLQQNTMDWVIYLFIYYFVYHRLEVGKSKIKVLIGSVSGEDLLSHKWHFFTVSSHNGRTIYHISHIFSNFYHVCVFYICDSEAFFISKSNPNHFLLMTLSLPPKPYLLTLSLWGYNFNKHFRAGGYDHSNHKRSSEFRERL
jgi:hypothetical protein